MGQARLEGGALIAPDALIVDLEPEGFARLSEVASHRLYAVGHEVHVLHASGSVLNAVDTKTGVVDRFREQFDDPVVRAREILNESGADRAVLIDVDGIGDLPAKQVDLARGTATQTELLSSGNRLFWDHPAVTVAPAPPASPWPRIFERMRSLGKDYWAVLGAWSGEELFLSLIARVERGQVTLLVSADHFGERPDRPQAHRLIEMVEERGPVRVALLCDLADFERCLRAGDPFEELRSLTGAIDTRGVAELLA
ncbi:MAG: hypothetical protein ACRDI1_00020 [Actinomycetota bacterium]